MSQLPPALMNYYTQIRARFSAQLSEPELQMCFQYVNYLVSKGTSEKFINAAIQGAHFLEEVRQHYKMIDQQNQQRQQQQQQLQQQQQEALRRQRELQMQQAASVAAAQAAGMSPAVHAAAALRPAGPMMQAGMAGPATAGLHQKVIAQQPPRVIVSAYVDRVISHSTDEMRSKMTNDDGTGSKHYLSTPETRSMLQEMGISLDDRATSQQSSDRVIAALQKITAHLVDNTFDMAAKYAKMRARAVGETRSITAGDVSVALEKGFGITVLPPGGVRNEVPEVARPTEVERALAAEKRLRDAQISAANAAAAAGGAGPGNK